MVAVSGDDATQPFVNGAHEALAAARKQGIRVAVLKEGSPSCGSGYVYDGRFAGVKQAGVGVTAQLLTDAGVRVFSEHQWAEAQACLAQLQAQADQAPTSSPVRHDPASPRDPACSPPEAGNGI